MSEFLGKPHITSRGVIEYRVSNSDAARRALAAKQKELNAVWTSQGSAWSTLIDWTPGSWQRNLASPNQTQNVLAFSAVYTCITLIAGDISKLHPMLRQLQSDGTWQEIPNSPKATVLRRPNHYQNTIQFICNWIVQKLMHGNMVALKERDNRGGTDSTTGVVRALYVQDWCNTTPLVADDGSVFYRLRKDYLSQIEEDDIIVPASEIIHDRMPTFWHPLIGVSPLYACGASALHGKKIQDNATKFFDNMSRPSGILTAPGKISTETANSLRDQWNSGFSGANVGKLAVVGDGLTYIPITVSATDAQLIEQLRWTVEDIARAFHVPNSKVNLPTNLTFSNAGQLDQDYYSQCLQTLIEAFESCLDDGLELANDQEVEFDIDGLGRMDPLGQAETNAKRVGAGELAPNEWRLKDNLPPVAGGESPYLQQQNYSLAALAKRDASADPFSAASPAAPAPVPTKDLADELLLRIMPAIGSRVDAENDMNVKAFADALIHKFTMERINA